MTGSSDFCY